MQKRYKRKRERNNKNKVEEKNDLKTFLITLGVVVGFVLVFYLISLGLSTLGVFEAGYVAPTKGVSEISYDEILIGNVFNKPEKSYYVVFDTYSDETNNVYVNYLVTSKEYDEKIYIVDMANPNNSPYKSNEPNKNATKASELKINDITLIKVSNGKILEYHVGDAEVEKRLKNLSK